MAESRRSRGSSTAQDRGRGHAELDRPEPGTGGGVGIGVAAPGRRGAARLSRASCAVMLSLSDDLIVMLWGKAVFKVGFRNMEGTLLATATDTLPAA